MGAIVLPPSLFFLIILNEKRRKMQTVNSVFQKCVCVYALSLSAWACVVSFQTSAQVSESGAERCRGVSRVHGS